MTMMKRVWNNVNTVCTNANLHYPHSVLLLDDNASLKNSEYVCGDFLRV